MWKKILPCDDILLLLFQFKLLPNPVYLESDEFYQPFVEIDENITITKELTMTIASQL